jgi:hypothetical protein
MRNTLPAVLLVLIVLGVVSGACLASGRTGILQVTTDRDVYHSRDIMKITVVADIAPPADNMTLKIEGIRDTHGKLRLRHSVPVNTTGSSVILLDDFELPPCSSCAGLPAGDYPFNVTLIRDDSTLSATNHTVRIEQ